MIFTRWSVLGLTIIICNKITVVGPLRYSKSDMLHVFDFVTCSRFWGSNWRSFIQPGRGKLLLEPSSYLEKCKNISNKEFEGSNYPNGPVIIRIIYKLTFIETPWLIIAYFTLACLQPFNNPCCKNLNH